MTIRRTLATAVAATLVLSACAVPQPNGAQPKPRAGEDVNRVDPSQLKDGGELRWPVDEIPANWNYFSTDGATGNNYRIFAALMPQTARQKPDGSVLANPDYVESAEVTSRDPLVVTYRLNPKAKWSDGRALSWEDFAAQAKALSGKAEGYEVSTTTGYEDISTVSRGDDDRTVKVTFARRFAEWRALFNPLLPKELNASASAFAKSWADGPSVTAGPFKIGSIDRTGKIVTVVRDDTWWGPRAKLDKITFRVVERPAQADALANGAIDFYEVGASIDLFQRAKSIPGVVLRDAAAPDYNHLTFNGAPSSILADPSLRTAIMRGIDPAIITRALVGGITNGTPSPVGNRLFLPGTKNYQDHTIPFSQDFARSTMDSLGWKLDGEYRAKDGKQLVLRYVIPTPSAPNEQVAKLVQSQLKAVGVKVDITSVPSTEFLTKWVFTGNFDVTGFRWPVNPFPIIQAKPAFYLDPANTSGNYGHIGSDTINKLFDEATAELDDDKRAALANRIDEELWKIAHQLPLYHQPGAVAVRSTIANLGAKGTGEFEYASIGYTS
ncbi:ABC transporter family substrate-binding protein [Lentzea sp. NPDC051838]|uniref:ABC transporter family substrate-binding protein n=1 Tax=Lentzea sp. NPDC051838 TaxID=3154849 RepID=UPI003420B2E6